jgi:integrase
MARLIGRYSAAYASNQYRALQQFFKWLAAEDQLPDPMAALQPPRVAAKLVPVFTPGELTRLERTCAGRTYTQRRDTAIIATLTATGIRLSELAGLRSGDVNLWQREITVRGKAASPGSFGSATRPPSAWTDTSAPAPGTRRPGGPSCGSEPEAASGSPPRASTR